MAHLMAHPSARMVCGLVFAALGCSGLRGADLDSGGSAGRGAEGGDRAAPAIDGGSPMREVSGSGAANAAAPAGTGGALARDQAGAPAGPAATMAADAGTPSFCPPPPIAGDISWQCTGWRLGDSIGGYDGWATIERSTAAQLVVYVSPERLVPAPSDLDGGVSAPVDRQGAARCTLKPFQLALPIYPVGARIWLHELHDRDYSETPRLHAGWEISLRTRQRGPLLVSSFFSPTLGTDLMTDALTLVPEAVLCTGTGSGCRANSRVYRQQVAAQTDSLVHVKPGSEVEITLAGQPYKLSLVDATRMSGSSDPQCAVRLEDDRCWVTANLRPRDSSQLGEQLDIEPLP